MSYLKIVLRKSLISVLLVLLFASCDLFKSDNPVGPNEDYIQSSELKELAKGNISSTGGIVTINSSGNPLNGMTIKVTEGSFSGSKEFIISSAEIKKHNFGEYFNPISPLIKIENGGGYADRIIEVKIPAKVPTGHFPMAFFWDEANGKLEPIPVLDYDATTVTVGTRHFSTSTIMPGKAKKVGGIIQFGQSYSKLIISTLSESVINGKPIISSGYKPGTDDWEFVNYGSYIAPGGHCAGQNFTAMWYYFEKKPSNGGLFGKYSDNANLWEDNAKGYRFCSTVHDDLVWVGTVIDFFDKYIDKDQTKDRLKWYMIAGAMLVTGEPQGIGIYRQTGTRPNGDPIYAGHDLICYQVSTTDGKLFISDPNKPNIPQQIEFANDRFKPYIAQQNGQAPSSPYPFVTYYAKTAYIEWDKIGKRWEEMKSGTIGNDKFPAYTLWVNNTGSELTDNFISFTDSLNLMAICPTAEVAYNVDGKKIVLFKAYDETGINKALYFPNATGMIKLNPGNNKFGFYIYGWREGHKTEPPNSKYIDKFIDFKWINVNYVKPTITIEPAEMNGATGTEYTWTAKITGLPKEVSYYIQWDFGEGSAIEKTENAAEIKHIYEYTGNHTIKATLYESTKKLKLAEATAKANIAGFEITSVSPTEAKTGDMITVKGKLFGTTQGQSQLRIGDKVVTSIQSWSDSQITFKVPSGTESGMVTIAKDGKVSNGIWLKIIGPLNITTLIPNRASHGDVVTIVGSGFGSTKGASNIYMTDPWGSIYCTVVDIVSWKDDEIKFKVPKCAATGDMYITSMNGPSNKVKFVLTYDFSVYKYCHFDAQVTATLVNTSGNITEQEHSAGMRDMKITINGNNFNAKRDTSYTKDKQTWNRSWQISATINYDDSKLENIVYTHYTLDTYENGKTIWTDTVKISSMPMFSDMGGSNINYDYRSVIEGSKVCNFLTYFNYVDLNYYNNELTSFLKMTGYKCKDGSGYSYLRFDLQKK